MAILIYGMIQEITEIEGSTLMKSPSATLNALVDRLIPPDDAPGGAEAGVAEYIVRQLAGDLGDHAALYQAGLAGLDAEAQAITGHSFASLAPATQDELLRRITHGETSTTWETDPATFLGIAAEHAAEGYYSDPGNGGNLGSVSWAMIGFRVTG